MLDMQQIGARAKKASKILAIQSTTKKNEALLKIAEGLKNNKEAILKANALDIENAKKTNYKAAFIERLTLNEERVDGIVSAVEYS